VKRLVVLPALAIALGACGGSSDDAAQRTTASASTSGGPSATSVATPPSSPTTPSPTADPIAAFAATNERVVSDICTQFDNLSLVGWSEGLAPALIVGDNSDATIEMMADEADLSIDDLRSSHLLPIPPQISKAEVRLLGTIGSPLDVATQIIQHSC
jgi:hypothetical protein